MVPPAATQPMSAVSVVAQNTRGDKRAKRPTALVYRGPVSCQGCSEATARLLRTSRDRFVVHYVGPREARKLTTASLAGVTLYAQPGGDSSVKKADQLFGKAAKRVIKTFVKGGGKYLGICEGAYLAGSGPGMGLLSPGNTGQYIATKGATTHSPADTVVQVTWLGKRRTVFFQDGPYILASHTRGERVLARYTNGKIAALVKNYGAGRVGVVGPHPEAPASWFREAGISGKAQGRNTADLGHQLINATMAS